MVKVKTSFLCSECGETFHKWMGKCSSCGSFNTIHEFREANITNKRASAGVSAGLTIEQKVQKLSECKVSSVERITTGFKEVDTVLGGGIVTGSMALVAGAPGIGKSTLLLQVAMKVVQIGKVVLYVSGEESPEQVALRAKRLKIKADDMNVLTETSVENIIRTIAEVKPEFVIIDSIQTLYTESITAAPGAVSQVRESTAMLMQIAKQNGISLYIIGHVTKDGSIAGPRVLEHMVDTVLHFEGESSQTYRLLRGIKNRFGPSGEIAIFGMESHGLVEMKDATAIFLNRASLEKPGSAVVPVLEGSRVLMVEVQALVSSSHFGLPQRVASGINQKKLALIVAILEKYAGIQLGDFDIFLNITGGLTINETAVDLAIAAALLSSFRNRPIPLKTSFVGELGLSGEIRTVLDMEKRIREVESMGFTHVVTPVMHKTKLPQNIKALQCTDIGQFEQLLM